MNSKVEAIGSFWESTAPFVALAKKAEKEKREKERRRLLQQNQYVPMDKLTNDEFYDEEFGRDVNLIEQMEEVKKLLVKAGIPSSVFPFKAKKDKDGEITFVPKGKNDKEIKEDIKKYKEELEKAVQEGKITQEEFEKLNKNLEELMEENEIELEEDKDLDFEITNDEIEENLEKLIIHNFGDEKKFEDLCKQYEDLDLNDRKNCLQEFNSKINTQLGIVGDLNFSTNPNLKFENSFTKNGFLLTEKQVENQDLKPMLYTMMEKSMMRQKEIQNGQKMEAKKKKEMHDKIMEERKRKYQQIQEKEAMKTKKRMRTTWNG